MNEELKITKHLIMHNISQEYFTLEQVCERIIKYINEEPDLEYDIAIGTDSMTYDSTHFVLAIAVHRLYKGGIFFYTKMKHSVIKDLRYKLHTETQVSVDAANILLDEFYENGIDLTDKSRSIHLHIHMDIGENGPTKDLIQELIGWVTALGYECEIKPDSYAASFLADKYSK